MSRAEFERLEQDARRQQNWKRWGPYLSERQWGTVREDYSEHGACWAYFPHDHARSRAYRWGEDGLLGICDRECRLCFALALWNGRDPILKERLFGLVNEEGNHGEDVKECYYYLDATPTHSYLKALYKYPQCEFPYARLVEENRRRGRDRREFELEDTGVFDGGRYFDVFVEYAKAAPDDVRIRVTVANRGPEAATLHALPTFWNRNTWSWGCRHEGCWIRPRMRMENEQAVLLEHVSLGKFRLEAAAGPAGAPEWLFTENETNFERLFGSPNRTPHVKDAFHARVIEGKAGAVHPERRGSKAAAWYRLTMPAGEQIELRLRLAPLEASDSDALGGSFERVFRDRIAEAEAFFGEIHEDALREEERRVARQAYAGLLWTKQFYHLVVGDWLEGDPEQPPPPKARKDVRNRDWLHLFSRDVLSMPDKWEYPWFAAWDLAFHMIPFSRIDPDFAKKQLMLLLREWYMHPNGQLPAYEFAFDDVNPPVHAWACWHVYKHTAEDGGRDRLFLERCFQKLLLNFTWWVNRKDPRGRNLFAGGFLGMDNIGVFDRSQPLPTGGHLEQADGTAWMAFYCETMLAMALELARDNPAYEDIASKFFEHFVAIVDAMNSLGGSGLWDANDGFYHDQLLVDGQSQPLRIRSLVGLAPLFAVEVLREEDMRRFPGFRKRMRWFLENRPELARHVAYMTCSGEGEHAQYLLAIPSRERLLRVLGYLLDEREFLSPYGIRSVSKFHEQNPFEIRVGEQTFCVPYVPGESQTGLFGGNSNWRGPIWFPLNYLLVRALEDYHRFYAETLQVECPTGSGRFMNLRQVAAELRRRLTLPFLPGADGRRPCHGENERYARDPHWRDLVLFHEYFHGETGRGLGASHQTGWTALVATCLEFLAAPSTSSTVDPPKGHQPWKTTAAV